MKGLPDEYFKTGPGRGFQFATGDRARLLLHEKTGGTGHKKRSFRRNGLTPNDCLPYETYNPERVYIEVVGLESGNLGYL